MTKQQDKKPLSEQETLQKIFLLARAQGCLPEAKAIYQKYSNLLKGCTDEKAYNEIATLGIVEMYNLLNVQGGLSIEGKDILPPNPNFKDYEL